VELERNLQTQFQLQKKKKGWEDAENYKQKSQQNISEFNSAYEN
jgi:hypothetical protein